MNQLEEERQRLIRAYGDKAASIGGSPFKQEVTSSGSLTLDYQSGMGGYQRGHAYEVFGAPTIGKTSLLGFNFLRCAQEAGYTVGVLAIEPDFDTDWAVENGVDLDKGIIAWPDSGEEAFEIYRDWVYSGVVDHILFDSIGALTEAASQGEEGKARVGGEAKLITWGVKRVLMRARKNNVTTMFINQQRDIMNAKVKAYESPGGWGLKHACKMRIQVKPGKTKYTAKIDDENIEIGREVVCSFKKAKAHNALGKTARFDWYWIETDDHPLGVDIASDIINIAKITKVMEGSQWLYHPAFPKGKLNGKPAVSKFFQENPKVVEEIRGEVLDKMHSTQTKRKKNGSTG